MGFSCRFCAQKLNRGLGKNIFNSENNHLLETALQCIPAVTMSVDDSYPKFACNLCVSMLNDFAEFRDRSLAVQNFFDVPKHLKIEFFSAFCRFCANKINRSKRKNILNIENKHLLKVALQCIPVQISADGVYPKFACDSCVYKMNDFAGFQDKSLSCAKIYNDLMSTEETENNVSREKRVLIKEEEAFSDVHSSEETDDFQMEELSSPNNGLEFHQFLSTDIHGNQILNETENEVIENKYIISDCKKGSRNQEHQVQCTNCNKRFNSTGEAPHKCQDCDKLEHIILKRKEISETSYKCDECKKRFNKKSNLVRHLKTHIDKKSHQCGISSKTFADKANRKNHHLFKCGKCGKSYTHKGNLCRHDRRQHRREECFQCEKCKNILSSKRSLLKHMKRHTCGKENHQCKLCSKRFSYPSRLAVRKATHFTEKPYHCKVCKKCFSLKYTLVIHMRIHTDEKPYQCDECQKSFNSRTDLKRHKDTHTKEKPFGCDDCGKHFSCRGYLAKHMRVHNDNKKLHKCRECGKSFSHKKVLVKHMRTHTAKKLYDCNECGKSFNARGNLARHLQIHSEHKPYYCDDCGRNFKSTSDLVRHLHVHNIEKPSYLCNKCPKTFNRKRSYIQHLKNHSSTESD